MLKQLYCGGAYAYFWNNVYHILFELKKKVNMNFTYEIILKRKFTRQENLELHIKVKMPFPVEILTTFNIQT